MKSDIAKPVVITLLVLLIGSFIFNQGDSSNKNEKPDSPVYVEGEKYEDDTLSIHDTMFFTYANLEYIQAEISEGKITLQFQEANQGRTSDYEDYQFSLMDDNGRTVNCTSSKNEGHYEEAEDILYTIYSVSFEISGNVDLLLTVDREDAKFVIKFNTAELNDKLI